MCIRFELGFFLTGSGGRVWSLVIGLNFIQLNEA